jgi:hypothetical protein
MSITVQQAATTYSLFISVNCSTHFWWYLHPSSGAHVTVSTASGIIKTVTGRELVSVQSRSRKVAVMVILMPDAVDTVTLAPDDGGDTTRNM